MTDKMIFQKLNDHLKTVQKAYPIDNIFGIFVTKINEKSIESEAVIIPLFEDICISNKEINRQLNRDISILDIRTAYKATREGHPETIEALFTDYIIINPKYQHIFQKLFLCNREKIKAAAGSKIPAAELKTALVKICRCAWNESSNVVQFIKQITDAEKLALDGIIKYIGDEGVISQAKVASAVGVSRLTMTNLIMKMKFNSIAEVTYLGNKGTYIKFIDDTVLNIRGLEV